jgi:hypothetical protein
MRGKCPFFSVAMASWPAHRPVASLRLDFGEPTQAVKTHQPRDGLAAAPMIFNTKTKNRPVKACEGPDNAIPRPVITLQTPLDAYSTNLA